MHDTAGSVFINTVFGDTSFYEGNSVGTDSLRFIPDPLDSREWLHGRTGRDQYASSNHDGHNAPGRT